jgi:repressor LexA
VEELTRRQRQILEFLVQTVDRAGNMPSHRRIGRRFGLRSPATVHQHLLALEEKGYLRRVGGDVVLDPRLRSEKGLAVVGRVAAGAPITAIENVEGRIGLSELFGGGESHFAVRVAGDSMAEAGILDGDYVVVRHGAEPRPGDVVVAYLGEEQEVTVKVFRRRRGRVVLEPRATGYDPIRIDPADRFFRLGGRVVGVFRRLG